MKVLSEKTLMPISLVIVLGGSVSWVSAVSVREDALSTRLDKAEVMRGDLEGIKEQVGRIDERTQLMYDLLYVPIEKRGKSKPQRR